MPMTYEAYKPPTADDYFNYIERHVPQVGDFRHSSFFWDLVEVHEPDQAWPLMPTEDRIINNEFMDDNWMFRAGVAIAINERRVDEFLEVARQVADPDTQTDILLEVIDRDKRPELLDEAVAEWEEHLSKAEDEDGDLNATSEYICKLAARYGRSDIFEASLSRLPADWQVGALAEAAAESKNQEYLERAVKKLEAVSEDGPDYDSINYLVERAATLGNYGAAVQTLIIEEDISGEIRDTVEEVVQVAVREGKVEDLREAAVRHADRLNLHHLSLELAKAGDAESATIAAETLRDLPIDSYTLYGNACRVALAAENLDDLEVKDRVLKSVKDFVEGAFYDARGKEDSMLAFYASLASLKIGRSLDLMKSSLFDEKDSAKNIAQQIIEDGAWGVYGPTGLLVCLIEEGHQDTAEYCMSRAKEPFKRDYITEEAEEMLDSGMITTDQHEKLLALLK